MSKKKAEKKVEKKEKESRREGFLSKLRGRFERKKISVYELFEKLRSPSAVVKVSRTPTFRVLEEYYIYEPYAKAVVTVTSSDHLMYFLEEKPLGEDGEKLLKDVLERLEYEIRVPDKPIEDVRTYIREELDRILYRRAKKLGIKEEEEVKVARYYVTRDVLGLGPLDPLLRDPHIEDVSVNGVGQPVYVWHQKYEYIPTNIVIASEEHLNEYIMRLTYMAGRHVSIAFPIVDAILPGGFRLAATYAREVSPTGSTLVIRKFREKPITITELMESGVLSPALGGYLWYLIENKKTILISGGTGVGKTTLLNALLMFVKPGMKIVTIEDIPELRLQHDNWTRLVTREMYTLEAGGKPVGMFDLVKLSLRYRPDYIIVGEIRGEEAFVLFQAIASVSHDTPVLIRSSRGEVRLVRIGEFIDKFYSQDEEWVPKPVRDYYVLSNDGYRVFWKPIQYVLRHKTNEVYEVSFEGGGRIEATGSHSVFVLDYESMELIEKPVSMIRPGELLVTFVKKKTIKESASYQLIDVIEKLEKNEKVYVSSVPEEIRKQCKSKNPIPLHLYLALEKNPRTRKSIEVKEKGKSHVLPGMTELDENLAFVFGAYIADGCIKEHNSKRICFTFGEHEKEMAGRVKEIMKNKFDLKPYIDNRGTYIIYEYAHTLLAELFEKLLGADLREKHLPPQLWVSPKSVIKAFFDGLKAGSRRTLRRRYTCYTTTNKKLAIEILWLARIAGYYSELVVEKGTSKNANKNYYSILVYFNENYKKPNTCEKIPVKLLLKLIELAKPTSMPSELACITRRKHVSRETALKVLEWVKKKGTLTPRSSEYLTKLEQLIEGELVLAEVKSVKKKPCQGYVYDISVPGTESFFGGNIPILLHNTGHGGATTLHAESLDFAIKRLSSPPINVPPAYLSLIDAFLLLRKSVRRMPDGRVVLQRRIVSLTEIEGPKRYRRIVTWDPVRDLFTHNLESSRVVEAIASASGSSPEDVLAEIEVRSSMLEAMVRNKIRSPVEVSRMIYMYYYNPQKTLKQLGLAG